MSSHLPNDHWDWHSGHEWYGGWIGYVCLLLPTIINNLVVFHIINSTPELSRSSSSLMVRLLAIEDALFSICCLIQCAVNLSVMHIAGERIGCEIQSFYCVFFMLSTGYTLCTIAYNSESKIAGNAGLSKRQVMIIHVFIWIVSALIAAGASYMVNQARLMPSGLYCLVSLVDIESGLLFYIPGVAFIGTFLCNRYWRMYTHVTATNKLIIAGSVASNARRSQHIKIAKRMSVIVAIFFGCILPHVLLGVYELIANTTAPASAYIITGNLIHSNSLLNPIIYVWMNPLTRKALWEKLGWTDNQLDTKRLTIAVEAATDDNRIAPLQQIAPLSSPTNTNIYTRQGNVEVDPVENARQEHKVDLFQKLSAAKSAWILHPDGTNTHVILPDDANMPSSRFMGPFSNISDPSSIDLSTGRLPVILESRPAVISPRNDSPESTYRDSQGLYRYVNHSSITKGPSHPYASPG